MCFLKRRRARNGLESFRNLSKEAAILFVHGMGGSNGDWGDFPQFLVNEPRLANWDVFAVSYATSKRFDFGFWADDPDLEKASLALQTRVDHAPLQQYKSLALITHSMGGLISQRVALNDRMSSRIGHLFLFGTPSTGTERAQYLTFAKHQIRDMKPGSEFLTHLRSEWTTKFEGALPFHVHAVAGERDAFIELESVLDPFPSDAGKVIPGDHRTMVKPVSKDDLSVRIIVDSLCGGSVVRSTLDSAAVSIEHRRYQEVIDSFLHVAESLDNSTLVELSLALDAQGRASEALSILQQYAHTTDAKGTLAGRYKRRWLLKGAESDWERAHSLYDAALAEAQTVGDPNQVLYHAINVAFLEVMKAPAASAVPNSAAAHAELALQAAESAYRDKWREATIGEARIILGDFEGALAAYQSARNMSASAREFESMYGQAVSLVRLRYDDSSVRRLNAVFGPADA
jgi:pimeloyl-ACP methyl ester carboxylesterase